MYRRDFLIKAFRVGGISALISLGYKGESLANIMKVLQCYNAAGAGGGGCSGSYGNAGTQDSSTLVVDGASRVVKIPLSCSGSLTSFTYEGSYVNRDDRQIYFLLYADSGGEPGTLISSEGPFWNASFANGPVTVTFNLSSSSITGDPTHVWAGIQSQSSSSRMYRISSGSQETRYITGTFGVIDNPWNTAGDSADATYDYLFTINF